MYPGFLAFCLSAGLFGTKSIADGKLSAKKASKCASEVPRAVSTALIALKALQKLLPGTCYDDGRNCECWGGGGSHCEVP